MADSSVSLFSQLFRLLRQSPAPGVHQPYPRLRNAILDIMAEGRRKNIINLLFEADVTLLRRQLDRHNASCHQRISLTACMAHALAAAVDQDRSVQAYRLGKKKMILFDEVDLAVMIEREIGGQPLPIVQIIRAANHKGVDEIQGELKVAKTAPLGGHGPLSRLEQRFFELPSVLRRLVWWFIRRDPQLFKQLAGTVGLTSMGMHGLGSAVVLPITPMTLTLSIGAMETKLVLENGLPVEREVICLNLGADHDLIDGAPLMRFAERFRTVLANGCPLPPSPLPH